MQSISRWALGFCCSRGRRIAFGAHRCCPPSLARHDDPLKPTADIRSRLTRFCNEPLGIRHFGVKSKNNLGTEGMDQETWKGNIDVEDIKITTANDTWPTDVWHASIIDKSTHRDGAIYNKNWGFWGQGCPVNLADRTENEMIQIFSLMLAKTPINSGSIQLYGYLAVRDYMDGHLNYVFNRRRDNPVVVQQGSFINMTGPRRGIIMLSEVLMEFDMRIKTGEKEEDDLQLIDGLINLDNRITRRPFTIRFNGSSGGAVDMCLTLMDRGMEAIIVVSIAELQSAFDLSLSSIVSVMEDHKEIQLFHGAIGESCQKRFVVAVPVDTVMHLKFNVDKKGTDDDIVHLCSFDANQHKCVNRQIKFEAACISVDVTVLPPLS
ncbi:unnamed protein product [Urochloa decumbens]|uniref:DUF6598 domain-containing protein n=1 Tax=Urochloa decumbens TaxID=240449 RepID=A0ABC9ACC5_9POAL